MHRANHCAALRGYRNLWDMFNVLNCLKMPILAIASRARRLALRVIPTANLKKHQ